MAAARTVSRVRAGLPFRFRAGVGIGDFEIREDNAAKAFCFLQTKNRRADFRCYHWATAGTSRRRLGGQVDPRFGCSVSWRWFWNAPRSTLTARRTTPQLILSSTRNAMQLFLARVARRTPRGV